MPFYLNMLNPDPEQENTINTITDQKTKHKGEAAHFILLTLKLNIKLFK